MASYPREEWWCLDTVGQCVVTTDQAQAGDQRHLVIINVYFPQADPEKLDRVRYKQMLNKTLDIWANRGCGGLVVGSVAQ